VALLFLDRRLANGLVAAYVADDDQGWQAKASFRWQQQWLWWADNAL